MKPYIQGIEKCLDSHNGYVGYHHGEHTILLDGDFTAEDLRKLSIFMEASQKMYPTREPQEADPATFHNDIINLVYGDKV